MTVLLLVVFGALMHAALSFAPRPDVGSAAAGTALAGGYLLLTAFLGGRLFARVGLPRLTGYLAAGIVNGPHLLGLLPAQMVADLGIVNGVAVALIALTAGVELELAAMRPLARVIAATTAIAIIGTAGLLALGLFLARHHLPFLTSLAPAQQAAVALVLGVTMAAQSPAVVVALREETRAEGPMTRTVLGVVVAADLVVILLFGGASTLAQGLLGAGGDALRTARELAWSLLGSGAVGAGIGGLLALGLRYVGPGGALFVGTVAFLVAEVGHRLQLDPLLAALAAGVVVRNLTGAGERLRRDIEAAAPPVYVAFFALAGATLHVDVLLGVGVPAALLVLLRASGFLAGARAAAALAGAPEAVRRWAGFGMLPQAGLALALAQLLRVSLPALGEAPGALVLGVVALNELVAPVLYRMAIARSGEAGQADAPSVAAHEVALDPPAESAARRSA